MGQRARHILITCAHEDLEDMERLVAGLNVHSRFLFFTPEELFSLSDMECPPPLLPLCHGFALPGCEWDVLAGLLKSVAWQKDKWIFILVEEGEEPERYQNGGLNRYLLEEFILAVSRGELQ